MASIVEISLPVCNDALIRCDQNGSAKQVVNMTNITGRKVRVGARLIADAPAKEKWFRFEPVFGERDLNPRETVQVAVEVQAPADAPVGKHILRVEVFSTAAPGEDYSRSDAIAVEIPPIKQEAPIPSPKPFPWWIAAAIAGVLLVGGVSAWLVMSRGPEVPDLIGLSITDAEVKLKEAGLLVGQVQKEAIFDQPVDIVLRTEPAVGTRVEKATSVNLIVAVAPTIIVPPPLIGSPFPPRIKTK